MKYACLVYLTDDALKQIPDRECKTFSDGLREAGRLPAAEALQPVSAAKTVRVRDGAVSVTDGPFAETKEHLAGFYIVEAATLEEALEVAARIPPAREGSIEVRAVRELKP